MHECISPLSCGRSSRYVARFPCSSYGRFNLGGIGHVILTNDFSIAWVNYVSDHIARG
jgi:hypothetical protein